MTEEIKFNKDTHTYFLDDRKIPSVTQIISSAGLSDFSKVNQDILKRSQSFGSAAHLACQLYDENRLDIKSLDIALEPRLEAWILFKRDFGIKTFKEIEKQVYSIKYQYAGCLDRLTMDDALIEIKTCTTIPKTTGLQLMGYQGAYEEMYKVKIKRRICVQLLDGTYKMEEYKEKSDRTVFLSCLNLHNWQLNKNA